ncbi:MAG: DUF5668 domain-containing protein [Clostridia bacterium]|nr:DUF5668 domain-containing protein [Clostridia bacterium]
MYRKNNAIIGLIFIALGVLFLLKNLNIFNIDFDFLDIGFLFKYFWPAIFLMLPGFLMHSAFFSGKNSDPGILVPGGILLTIGFTCQVSMLFGIWHVMWPGFIAAVAVGLFELYLFGTRDKALLIPVGILGGLSAIFFFTISLHGLFDFRFRGFIIPLALIIVGASIMAKNRPGKNDF